MSKNIAAIIQARMGSTRCPGKVLRPIAKIPMLGHITERLRSVENIDKILLAVPDSADSKLLLNWARKNHIEVFQGPEEDVLKRYILAAKFVKIDNILRICADSPLMDLTITKSIIDQHKNNNSDYTTIEDVVPPGTFFPIVTLRALERIASITEQKKYREHVVTYILDHPSEFRILNVPAPSYLKGKKFRLTVDTEEDLLLMEKLYEKFYQVNSPCISLEDVIPFLENHPKIVQLNSHVIQKNWREDN